MAGPERRRRHRRSRRPRAAFARRVSLPASNDPMQPFVSVLTPTRNRRVFIPQLLRCYRQQDYPLERMELVVLDDGEDPVADLLEGVPGVRYLRAESASPIGAKRNHLARAAQGEILVHMDDDDYYPRERVSRAVRALAKGPAAIAGASAMHIYFVGSGELGQTGPFGPGHATANTMAYTREYLATHRFDDALRRGEEPLFTDNWSAPMAQLPARETVLMLAHGTNTYDKSALKLRPIPYTLKDLVSCKTSLSFYRYQLPKLLGRAGASGR
jgi:glycosyltransferase involved in cell wall biosynthesis